MFRTNITKANNSRGFTLIELLTVIAIIAILMAIIFPVFSAVRENARQSTSISNLRDISSKMALYKLDNHKNPDVLFGYVYHVGGAATGQVVAMDQALAQSQADYNNGSGITASNPADYFPGLYPEYITDVSEFTDSNNTTDDKTADTGPLNVNTLSAPVTGKPNVYPLTVMQRDFYIADSYDTSPEIDGTKTNTLVKNAGAYTYVPRYQSSWSYIDNTLTDNYSRQLRWKFPPANTYVTCTTYHVPYANKVLVLFEDGSVKKMDVGSFLASSGGTDASDISVDATSEYTIANFWKVMPTSSGL